MKKLIHLAIAFLALGTAITSVLLLTTSPSFALTPSDDPTPEPGGCGGGGPVIEPPA